MGEVWTQAIFRVIMVLSYLQYRRNLYVALSPIKNISLSFISRGKKRQERNERITNFLNKYTDQSLENSDKAILATSVATVVSNVHQGNWTPRDVLHAYARKTLAIHAQLNCLSEIMLDDAERWAIDVETNETKMMGPLAGMPVSLKDTVAVAGYDATAGYAAYVGKPIENDSPIVRLLRDAGAILYVKTTIPTTLLSYEGTTGLFGRTLNPHNGKYSPGGSSSGEAALLAAGGSRIGIGSDGAGSVRVPAHYSGVYSIRASTGRFPVSGDVSNMPGQEGVPAVTSPMARTLEDLETFWEAIIKMEPWKYDHAVSSTSLCHRNKFYNRLCTRC